MLFFLTLNDFKIGLYMLTTFEYYWKQKTKFVIFSKICKRYVKSYIKQHRYLSKSKCLLINPMAFKMFLPTFYIFHHIRFRPGYLNWTAIETFFSVKENVNLKDDWTFFRNVTNIYAIFYIFHRDLNQWNAKNQLNSSDTIHHIINNNCSNIVIAQQLIFKKKKNVFKKW